MRLAPKFNEGEEVVIFFQLDYKLWEERNWKTRKRNRKSIWRKRNGNYTCQVTNLRINQNQGHFGFLINSKRSIVLTTQFDALHTKLGTQKCVLTSNWGITNENSQTQMITANNKSPQTTKSHHKSSQFTTVQHNSKQFSLPVVIYSSDDGLLVHGHYCIGLIWLF